MRPEDQNTAGASRQLTLFDDPWTDDGSTDRAGDALPDSHAEVQAGQPAGSFARSFGAKGSEDLSAGSMAADVYSLDMSRRPERSTDVDAAGLPSPPRHEPGTSVLPRAATLKGAVGEYKQYLAAMNRSRHTQESFGLDLKLLVEHLGDPPLTLIAERDLRSFISWVRMERHNSPTSVRRKVASLKNFFSYLHRERLIASDPALRLIYPDIYPALPEFLEDSQVADLLAAAEEHLFWKALIVLMLATGLKRDEVVALGRSDVQLSDQGGYLVVRETEQAKRLRSRRLELEGEVVSVLRQYALGEPERDRVFDVSVRGVNFIVETCGKRAHITMHGSKLTPQVLRETFAVRQMRSMVAQEDRMRRAGRSEEALAPIREGHDLQLLRLLGLHEEQESAKKYRKLVRGWAAITAP